MVFLSKDLQVLSVKPIQESIIIYVLCSGFFREKANPRHEEREGKAQRVLCMNKAVTIKESINAVSLLNNHYKSSIGVEHFT